MNKLTNKRANERTDGRVNKRTDRRTDRQTDRHTAETHNERTNERQTQTNRQTDRQTDKQRTNEQTDRHLIVCLHTVHPCRLTDIHAYIHSNTRNYILESSPARTRSAMLCDRVGGTRPQHKTNYITNGQMHNHPGTNGKDSNKYNNHLNRGTMLSARARSAYMAISYAK